VFRDIDDASEEEGVIEVACVGGFDNESNRLAPGSSVVVVDAPDAAAEAEDCSACKVGIILI
jgi:hypothetical protein